MASAEEFRFEAPAEASFIAWLRDGRNLLLVSNPPAGSNGDRAAFLMNAMDGSTSKVDLPAGATVGPGAEFDSFSPDGRYVSYPMFTGNDSHYDLWMIEIATRRTCLLMTDAPSYQYPEGAQWSPNSHWLTYATRYQFDPLGFQGLHIVDPATCADQAVGPDNGGQVSWSPSGAFLTIATQGPTVSSFVYAVWRPDGTLVRDGLSHPPVWAPSGALFASVEGVGVSVYDAETGMSREYLVHTFSDVQSTDLLWSPDQRYLLVYGHSSDTLRSSAGAQMFVLDLQTASVATLIDDQRNFVPTGWLP